MIDEYQMIRVKGPCLPGDYILLECNYIAMDNEYEFLYAGAIVKPPSVIYSQLWSQNMYIGILNHERRISKLFEVRRNKYIDTPFKPF